MASFNIQRVTGAPGVPCPFRGWLEPLLPLYVRSTDESTVHQGQCCEPEPVAGAGSNLDRLHNTDQGHVGPVPAIF